MDSHATCPDVGGASSELLELVGDIYQAGLEPERWPEVMARMSQAFEADLACIYTPFPARPEQALYLTHNFTPDIESAYSGYYHRIDAWTGHALRQGRYVQGHVALGEEIVPQRELRRTEFYNDFLKPHDMEWMVTAALLDGRAEGPAAHMSFTRHRDRGAYDGDGKRLIERLAPHVRRALLTHWRLTEARLGGEIQQSALEHLGYGVVMLDDAGRVLYLNPQAESMLRAGDGFLIGQGRLSATRPGDDAELARLLRQAGLGVGGGIRLERTPGKDGRRQPYLLSATPLRAPSLSPPPDVALPPGPVGAVACPAADQGPGTRPTHACAGRPRPPSPHHPGGTARAGTAARRPCPQGHRRAPGTERAHRAQPALQPVRQDRLAQPAGVGGLGVAPRRGALSLI
jgi:PAS domain-containing protein